MKHIDEYRDPELVRKLVAAIADLKPPPMTIMEICGTHTMAIGRFGIRKLLPSEIKLISGPGCPVCVTPQSDIDAFLALAARSEVTIATFGDMVRVPGSVSSLEKERARGADVRVVYSAIDALELSSKNPKREVIFLGVGFETTTPATALAIACAARNRITNFSVYCAHKTIPTALELLLSGDAPNIDGLLLPGHVSTIIGMRAYEPIAKALKIPGVISGFEPTDILQSILMLALQIMEGRAEIENSYGRAVSAGGNNPARIAVQEIFEPCDASWRGIGVIPGSGLKIREEYTDLDASRKFAMPSISESDVKSGCMCGEILRGRLQPPDCPHFGTTCTPTDPVGPCMVSSEGTCAAWHRYGGE